MKKGKRLLSLFTAVAIAMSSFASFIVTANADDTATISAALVHTAAAQGGSNAAGTSLDSEEHYINNWGESGWAATGYTEFSIADTDMTTDLASKISNITLTFQTKCGRGTRPMDVGLLDKDATAAIDFTSAVNMITKPATVVASYSDITTDYATKTVDVTEALKSRIAGGETRFIFAYAGATAGGNIYGKGAAEANQPSLKITYIPPKEETTTTTHDFEDGTNIFTDDSRIALAVVDDGTETNKIVTFTCANNAQNGYSFAHYDFSTLVEKAIKTEIEFDYYNTNGGRAILTLGDAAVRGTTGGSSKTTYSNTGAAFNLGSNKNNAILNDASKTLADFTDKWMHVKVTIDEKKNTYTYKITSGEDTLAESTEAVSFLNTNADAVSQIDVFGYINNSLCAKIDNLKISATVDNSATYTDITVKHIDGEGNEIKTAETLKEAALVGDSYTYEETISDFDAEDGSCRYFYDATASTLKINKVADKDNVIEIVYSKKDYKTVTVNNVAGEKVLKTYTDKALEGSTYNVTAAQLGYKLVDDVYYMVNADATKSAEVTADGATINIAFTASNEAIIDYEDFENVTDSWGFVPEDKSVPVVSNGSLSLTTFNNAASNKVADDVKTFGKAVANMTKGTLEFDYMSGVEANKNRTSAFAVKDSEGNVIIQLFGTGAATNDLSAGVTYTVGEALYDTSLETPAYTGKGTLITGSSTNTWYHVALNLDFTGDTNKVSGTISTLDGTTVATIAETEMAASNVATMNATIIYSLAPQYIDNVKITGETPKIYKATVADTENGSVSVDAVEATEGEKITITATPAEGYIVDTIAVKDANGADVTVAADNTFTMPASNVTVTVTFKVPPVMYSVAVADATNGSVAVNKTSAGAGETVTITATPAEGYTVDTITVIGADTTAITVENGAFTMPEQNVTVTVTFKVIPKYDVAVADTIPEEGSVAVDKTTAAEGEEVTITATPANGYEVDTIAVKDADGADVTVTGGKFTMPAKKVTVTVTFKAKEAVDYTKIINFTDRSLTAESKGSSTVFEATDAATAGAKALAAAEAGNVLKFGSSANGAGENLGYKAQFAVEDGNTVVYGGQATMSFKLEPMQVRTDKEASIVLSFADINGNTILPITVGTDKTASLTVNGTAATNIAYGNYYVVTYTMDFTNKTAGVKITTADGATTCLELTGIAITAENITQMYKADSDWTYGYCAIDDIKVDATEIGVPVFYTITINTERFAKMTTSTGSVYYADVNGKLEIPLQKPGTAFDYTLSKVGYTDVTGNVAALTADFTDEKPMTKSDENIVFIESEFGNTNEAYVSPGGNRNDEIALGSVEIPDISEIVVDFEFAGFGGQGGQQKTWFIKTDAGELVGIQIVDDGMYAWTGWTGAANHNQSSDAGAYTNGVKIGDVPSGAFTVKFVLDKTNKAITVSYGDSTNSLSYTIEATTITGLGTGLYRYNGELKTTEIKIAKPDVNYLAINGASGVAKISGKTIERTYSLSQTVIVPDETFTWTVADAEGNAVEGVTIENGVLKVADTATAGTVVITCASATNENKKATFNVTIGDFQQMTTFVIDGPKSFDVKEKTGNYKVVSAVDSFGDEVKDLLPAVVWTTSDEAVVTVDAATGVATVVGAGNATITATITNGTAVTTATIPVTVATYYIVEDATGDSTSVDISSIVNDSSIVGYMVTTTKDGAVVKQTKLAKSEIGSITIAEDAAERIVVTYNETGAIASVAATKVGKGEEVDMAGTETSKVFLWNSLNGMVPVSAKTISGLLTVDTTGADKVEVAPIYETAINRELLVPSATYDVTITVSNGARTDVYVNDQMMFNNVNQGSDNWTIGRILPASAEYTANDVVIGEGYATFKMYDDKSGGSTVQKVTFVKTPDNKTRAKRIYAIGDSLVAKYYGDAPEGSEGLVRTGWGDVLGDYVAEGVAVTNLGNSGAHAEGMLSDAFTNVIHSAKAGDIVVWESGYNDRSYSTIERMKAAITKAIDYCKENNIKIYLVSPNASSHDYKESVVWASSIIELGTETKTPVIDLSKESYNFLNNKYSSLEDVHTLLRAVYNNTGDTLHSSYNAANCWAAIVAQGLYNAGETDFISTEHTYTYNDGTNDITVGVGLMNPVQDSNEGDTSAE